MPKKLDHTGLQQRFFQSLRRHGTLKAAMSHCGITRNTVKAYRQANPEFDRRIDYEIQCYRDTIDIAYGKLHADAVDELRKRVESGSLSDLALLKVIGVD